MEIRTVCIGLSIMALACCDRLSANPQSSDNNQRQQVIDLAGRWRMGFDSAQYNYAVTLPGTTDTNGLGEPCADKTETTRLSRRFSYKGEAWYNKSFEVPADSLSWTLILERTKLTRVYVDGKYVGTSNNISTPQRFTVEYLAPGRHDLTIMVDNSKGVPEQIYGNSHAYTEDTQTNWNGIIGNICLISGKEIAKMRPAKVNPAFNDFHIEGRHFYANGHRIFLRGKHDACVQWMNGSGTWASARITESTTFVSTPGVPQRLHSRLPTALASTCSPNSRSGAISTKRIPS